MPGPKLDSVETDQALPPKASVIVIGGGIIGASTALFMAERGLDVVLCEKGELGGEQSSRNWGWVRKQGRAQAPDGDTEQGAESGSLGHRRHDATVYSAP